jgi:hypothetical protein
MMASRRLPGPLGWGSDDHGQMLGSGMLPGPLGTGWHAPLRLPEDSWHPPMAQHSEADRALGRMDLEALRESYGNVLSEDGNREYAVFETEGWTYRVDEYLTHRDSFFGSRFAYEAYLGTARGELEANGGKFRESILARRSAPRWREAQDIFWAWTRKAYENKLGPNVDLPKLIRAKESEKLKVALRQVQVDFGSPFVQQTMSARPMKARGAFRLGTLSDHALGEAVDIWPTQNPQVEEKQWDGILAFAGKKLDVPTRILWWKTAPEQLHKAIVEIKDSFVSKLAEAVAAQTAAGSTDPLGEVVKASPDLKKVGLDWVRQYQNGFFTLPWALVKELHEEQFLWGATFKRVDLHHFEL